MKSDCLNEKCAVFAVYGKDLDAARLTYFGLYALQHRGQEASGIAASDGQTIHTHKGMGLVPQVYSEDDFTRLTGHMAVGHNRYSTSGGSGPEHNQPVVGRNDILALAHNGNLPETKKLEKFLHSKGMDTSGSNDSEMMYMVIKYFLVKGNTLEEAIQKAYPLFTGAFCILAMTRNKIVAIRDPYGIRPLSLAKIGGGYAFSSETCAFDTIDATYVRDVEPGEMVVVSENGLESHTLAPANQKLDIFEFIYFSRPDSKLLGKSVYQVRKNLGIELAREAPLKADVVIPIPDSAVPAAIGYALKTRIPFEHGLVKNRYIGRTFILPDQHLRDRGVQMKLNPVPEVVKGKRVVVIDDSIVRGTTVKKVIAMLREAGAKEVHLMSSCPPIRFPDFYGIDTPNQNKLIAAKLSIAEIRDHVGADSLHFLSFDGMIKATGLPENVFCTSCFNGDYPLSIGKRIKEVQYAKKTKKVTKSIRHEKAHGVYLK